MNVTTPDGRTLQVWIAGDEGGVPVLAHHGTPSSGVLYGQWVVDAAAQGICMIGYDRPGYGGSSRNAGRTIADAVADVRAIAAALGIERLVTWGISGGGPHVLACAALAPDLVAAAACMAGPAPFDAEGLDWTAGMGEANVVEHGAAAVGEQALRPMLKAMSAAMLGGDTDAMAEELATLLSPVDAASLSGPFGGFIHESTEIALHDSVDGWVDDDLAFVNPWGFDVASIRVPLLLIQGAQDGFVPVGHLEWLAAHIPAAERRLVPEQGHLSLSETGVSEVHEWLLAHQEDPPVARRTRG